MRIRRSASRLLGAAAASASCTDPPRFEPAPPPAPAPAPAHESRAGGIVGPETSSSGEPCCKLNQSPWDLMAQLDLSDPQVEGLFVETCFVSVAWRPSWLFSPSITMPAGSIKEEEDMPEDLVDGIFLKMHKAVKKTDSKNNGSTLKTNKEMKVKKGVSACKKNDGKGLCCRRLVTEPNSYCSYHSDLKPPVSEKPRRKRPAVDVDEGFYYYAGFGPGTKRRRTASSNSVLEPPLPAEPLKEEAPSEMQLDFGAGQVQATESEHKVVLMPSAHVVGEPTCNNGTAWIAGCHKEINDDDVPEPPLPAEAPKEEALQEEAQTEMQFNSIAAQAQADDSDHQAAPASVSVVDEPKHNDITAGIAGCDEESSDSDDEALGCNGEQPRDIIKRKGPFKKRWRKPVKARSLKSLMA